MTRLLPLLITLSLSGAIHSQEPQTGNPQKPAEPQSPAQIELLETKVRFEANGDSRKEVHCIVKINSELGVRQFARLNFDYNRTFEKIEIPFVRVTHSSGGVADILPSAITDNPNPAVVNYPAYQDVRDKSIRILGLAPSDTLEYRIITTVTHHPLAPDFWLDHTFDRSGIVSHELFDLDLPGHLDSTSMMGNWPGSPAVIVYLSVPPASYRYDASEDPKGRSIYRWDIPSTRKLPVAADSDGAPAPDVLVSSFGDWYKLVGSLSSHFLNWTNEDREQAQAKLHGFAPHAGPAEKLRAVYDFVSQKIATADLPVGATGFRLRPVKEVLESSYATPEEKCSLLALFANLAGIKAEVVLMAGPETQMQFGRPSVFTHAFVIASEKTKRIALDPSMGVAPFGVIPSDFRGKSALSLTLGDAGDVTYSKWTPLPAELPFASSQRVSVDASLAADGALNAKVHYTLRGDNELLLRLAFHQSPREKWSEVAQLLALSDGFRGKVAQVSASDPYATRDPFTVEYEISQPKFVDWSKKPMRIPAILPLVGLPDPPAGAKSSIELGTPLDVQTTVTLHLPPGITVESPAGTAIDRDYATFSSQYSASANTITASRHVHFIARELPASRAADYNAFVRAIQNDQSQRFTITPSDAPTRSSPPAKP